MHPVLGSCRWGHAGFEVDAQAVGDAVDVVEVGDDLDGVVDGAVVEAVLSENLDVGFGGPGGGSCELDGEVTQGPVCRR